MRFAMLCVPVCVMPLRLSLCMLQGLCGVLFGRCARRAVVRCWKKKVSLRIQKRAHVFVFSRYGAAVLLRGAGVSRSVGRPVGQSVGQSAQP